MTKNQIKYVAFEPAAALTDSEVASMTDKQYRAYWTLIHYLYCNNGKCSADIETLAAVCHCGKNTTHFAQKVWPKVSRKFQIKGGFVRHSRVTTELRRAQLKRKQAVAAANARWNKVCERNAAAYADAMLSETKAKRSEGSNSLTNTKSSHLFAANSLRLYENLVNTLKPKTTSDMAAIKNVVSWLNQEIIAGKFSEDIFAVVLEFATEAQKTGRKPIALFFATVKREIGYGRGKRKNTKKT